MLFQLGFLLLSASFGLCIQGEYLYHYFDRLRPETVACTALAAKAFCKGSSNSERVLIIDSLSRPLSSSTIAALGGVNFPAISVHTIMVQKYRNKWESLMTVSFRRLKSYRSWWINRCSSLEVQLSSRLCLRTDWLIHGYKLWLIRIHESASTDKNTLARGPVIWALSRGPKR